MSTAQLSHVPPAVGSAPGWPLVLYFHRIRAEPKHYTELSPEQLEFALDLVAERMAPLDPHAVPAVADGERPHDASCLVTFDDGDLSVWTHAAPALEARGWRSLFFVNTDDVPDEADGERMTWVQLRALRDRGHVVASHGACHRDLAHISAAAATADLARAATKLEEQVGTAPDMLAFPYGRPPKGVSALPSICFGSVRALPHPWPEAPRAIRRTYFPSAAPELWRDMVTGWCRPWKRRASR